MDYGIIPLTVLTVLYFWLCSEKLIQKIEGKW